MTSARVMVGVLRADLAIPGARTLKDRRQVLRSLRDRLRARFDVACHELLASEHPGVGAIVVTTAGEDGPVIRRTLDTIAGFLRAHGGAVVRQVDHEVFPWHPPDQSWADILPANGLSGVDEPWTTEEDDG